MAIALVLILLGLLVAAFVCFVRALLRLRRTHATLILGLLIAIPLVACKGYERSVMLSFVPDALDVHSIAYTKEESWGFGPGGNEAGVRVYPLGDEVARKIEAGGLKFFATMPSNEDQASHDWRGRYEDWHETPIRADVHWQPNPKTGRMAMYDYVCAYGFCIDVDPDVVREVEQVVNEPGNYYAYGRIGVIVVSPKSRKVFYLYNG